MARSYRFFLRNPANNKVLASKPAQLFLAEADEPEIVFQLSKVLRATAGDEVILQVDGGAEAGLSGAAAELHYTIEMVQKKQVDLKLVSVSENTRELGFELSLVLCLPNKPDKLEFILQKAVEIGVTEVVTVAGDFSQMKHQLRMDRLEKIMIEAAEQSERAMVPGLKVASEKSLQELLKKVATDDAVQVFVAVERLNQSGAKNPFAEVDKSKKLMIVIGPEGGFSPEEKALVKELGITSFSLGKRILRMETAAIVALGLAALRD